MSQYIGFDAPDLSPAPALRAYARIHAACIEAELRWQAYGKRLTRGPSGLPSAAVVKRQEQFQARFEELLGQDSEAKASAISVMKGLGVDVGVGGVRLDGRLFLLAQDDHYDDTPPFIVIIDLAGVRDI